jgi:hypothetical protein
MPVRAHRVKEVRRKALVEAMAGVPGYGAIDRAFAAMRLAEDEIGAAKRRHPAQAALLHRSFEVLCAPPLHPYDDRVYRAHARELLDRLARGDDTRPGTCAEALVAVMQAVTVAPPGAQLAALAEHLFVAVFGKPIDDSEPPREPWKGASDELLADLRRRLTDTTRVLTKEAV